MKREYLLALLVSFIPICAHSSAQPQNLESSFRAAITQTETIGIDIELINQAEEKYRQAIAADLPQISGNASYLRQQVPNNATGNATSPGAQPLAKLTMTQSIFQGLRDFATFEQTKKQREATEQEEKFARLTLFTSVAQNFYSIVNLQRELSDYSSEVDSYKTWIKALEQRIKIGRSQVTEVLTVQATLAGVYAQIELAKGQLNVARELYFFITGFPTDTPLVDDQPLARDVLPIEKYVDGVNDRPDVRANQFLLDAAHEQLTISKETRLPTVGFTGDYYLYRYGVTSDVKWDAQFLLSVPLYTGGTIDSQVRNSMALGHEQDLTLSLNRRQSEELVRAAYRTYVSDQAQLVALRNSKKANDLNVKAEEHDYRLGLVTNLDVLTALVAYQVAVLALDTQTFTTKLDYMNLENQSNRNSWIGPHAEVTTHWSPLSPPVF